MIKKFVIIANVELYLLLVAHLTGGVFIIIVYGPLCPDQIEIYKWCFF